MSLMLKDMPTFLKPRERLKTYGVASLTNEELLAILLRTGTKDISVKNLALNVLQTIEKIADLENLTLNSLIKIKGMGEAKAMSILAALELGKRVFILKGSKEIEQIRSGKDVYAKFKYLNQLEQQENLIALLLDNKSRVIESKVIFKGSLNTSIAHPREIFKYAINNNAAYIIIVHNHPSGDATPSPQDKLFTQDLIKSGKIIGIEVIDHIIIGKNNYYTYKENKVINL